MHCPRNSRLLFAGGIAVAVHALLLLIVLPNTVGETTPQLSVTLSSPSAGATTDERATLGDNLPVESPMRRAATPEQQSASVLARDTAVQSAPIPVPPRPAISRPLVEPVKKRPGEPQIQTASAVTAPAALRVPSTKAATTTTPKPITSHAIDTRGQLVGLTPSTDHNKQTLAENPAEQGSRATQALKLQLAKHFRYPMAARKKGWQGEVLVGLVIQPNGSILDIQLLRSSGIPLLDRSAVKTLSRIAERGGIQPNLVAYPLTISLPIAYQLTS